MGNLTATVSELCVEPARLATSSKFLGKRRNSQTYKQNPQKQLAVVIVGTALCTRSCKPRPYSAQWHAQYIFSALRMSFSVLLPPCWLHADTQHLSQSIRACCTLTTIVALYWRLLISTFWRLQWRIEKGIVVAIVMTKLMYKFACRWSTYEQSMNHSSLKKGSPIDVYIQSHPPWWMSGSFGE